MLTVNEQFHLSPIEAGDQSAALEYLNDKDIYHNTLRIPFPYTATDFQTYVKIVEKSTHDQGQAVQWAIRNAHGKMIGGCGFDGFIIGKSHRAEIGYWLAKPLWGQGIMSAVVKRACAYAFAVWGLVKIEAHVFARNPASAAVLRKCGFVKEGDLRMHYYKDGEYLDAYLYALFNE